MDLVRKPPELNLSNRRKRIYSRNAIKPPHFTAEGAKIVDSLITEGSSIFGSVKNSVISDSVQIGKGSEIVDSVIFPNVSIGMNCKIYKTMIGKNTVIGDNCAVNEALKIRHEHGYGMGVSRPGRGGGSSGSGSSGGGGGTGGAGGAGGGEFGAEHLAAYGVEHGEGAGYSAAAAEANTSFLSEYCTGGVTLIGENLKISDNTIIGENSMVDRDI